MEKRFFLFVLIVLTVITVSCKIGEMSGSGNVISGNASGQSDSQGSEQEPVRTGVFTVNSAGKQVVFSPGALYWDGSSFKMEENQYDYRTWNNAPSVINGVYTANNTAIPAGETGLFYWSKYVEKTYALNYDRTESTSDTFALASGGAIAGWDVLSADEWTYLTGFDSEADARQDAASKYGLATITTGQGASVKGIVLLPDEWTMPAGFGFTPGPGNGGTGYGKNNYTSEQWAKMEQAGAVFLPAAGCRNGSSVNYAGGYGYWWSSTPDSNYTDNAYYLYFYSDHVDVRYSNRNNGRGVRLVAPVRN